jgi:hypothetical protein
MVDRHRERVQNQELIEKTLEAIRKSNQLLKRSEEVLKQGQMSKTEESQSVSAHRREIGD